MKILLALTSGVSSYVANLAAFLTKKSYEGEIRTIEGAVAAGWNICTSAVLKIELEIKHPKANFIFTDLNGAGIIEYCVDKKSDALALSWEDTRHDEPAKKMLCDNNLAFTDSVIMATPIGFPIRPHLAPAFSVLMRGAETLHDYTVETAVAEHWKEVGGRESVCDITLSTESTGTRVYDPITVEHMALPLLLFATCTILAVIFQFVHQRHVKTGQRHASLLATISQLELTTDHSARTGRVKRRRQCTVQKGSESKKHNHDEMPQAPKEDSSSVDGNSVISGQRAFTGDIKNV